MVAVVEDQQLLPPREVPRQADGKAVGICRLRSQRHERSKNSVQGCHRLAQ